jgi:hypothetical protein
MSLFNVETAFDDNVVNINGVDFNRVVLSDKKTFEDIYFKQHYSNMFWENNFAYIYAYADASKSTDVLWKIINGFMCVFIYIRRSKRLASLVNPVAIGKKLDKNTLVEILKIFKKVNGSEICSNFIDMNKNNLHLFNVARGNGLGYDDLPSDFIFKCEDLIKLEGSKFKSRRQVVNQFKRRYPNYVIRYATDNDLDAIFTVRDGWIKARFKNIKQVWDREIFKSMIKYRKELGIRTMVAEVDGIVEGFLTISKLCDNCSVVITENTNLKFQGMTELLWYESLKMNLDLGEYEDDGNGGLNKKDGLYRYKASNNPVDFVDKFIISYKGKKYSTLLAKEGEKSNETI